MEASSDQWVVFPTQSTLRWSEPTGLSARKRLDSEGQGWRDGFTTLLGAPEMTTYLIETMSDDELVELFRQVAEQQYYAAQTDRHREYDRLYREMEKIETELKRRPDDARRMLIKLFPDRNPQIRLMAAGAALAVLPEEARSTLQKLSESGEFPQAADAGMLIDGLDDGTYIPE